jgi:hypothetical protein
MTALRRVEGFNLNRNSLQFTHLQISKIYESDFLKISMDIFNESSE